MPTKGSDGAVDPNFPAGLRIQPSSSNRPRPPPPTTTPDASSHTVPSDGETPSWEVDTAQDIELYGIAGRIWEAAYLLARYLVPPSQAADSLEFDPPCSLFPVPGQAPLTIVELGSGAGYGSLHLARQLVRHADVMVEQPPRTRLVLTDLENVVPLMERNVERAGYKDATDILDARVRSLAWGNQAHASSLIAEMQGNDGSSGNPITHILCSDLVYFPELLPPLLRSIISLSNPSNSDTKIEPSTSPGPQLVISYKIRSLTKEQPFWSALGSWFEFEAVDCRTAKGEWHRFGSEGADYGASADADQELFVFVGHRRPDTFDRLAPERDTELMLGKRLRPGAEWDSYELETPASGQDYFEWLLLSNMGAGLG